MKIIAFGFPFAGNHVLPKSFIPREFNTYYVLLQRYIDGESTHQEDYRGKHHLVATNEMKFCLDASPKQKLISKFKRGTFTPCKWDANQMWRLNPNGTMVKNYSGLCVIAESVKDGISPGGICFWIAKGRRGE
ncbi:hypothetical protein Ahy_B04g072042 isoform D [Arachis hypogaea]|uniref:Ricin B lectin domain-containing protein n=1 Tax=Arachis hypogaea TaxID=3818 RepID=A0A444ZMC9_ARAHY|nr:hypothetical protein Ahy_B04g072042 isoform D [Arachis hypogaea]